MQFWKKECSRIGTVCIVTSSKKLVECTVNILEKQAAAMAIWDQFCDVFSLCFKVFLLILFVNFGVETYVLLIWILSSKDQIGTIDLPTLKVLCRAHRCHDFHGWFAISFCQQDWIDGYYSHPDLKDPPLLIFLAVLEVWFWLLWPILVGVICFPSISQRWVLAFEYPVTASLFGCHVWSLNRSGSLLPVSLDLARTERLVTLPGRLCWDSWWPQTQWCTALQLLCVHHSEAVRGISHPPVMLNSKTSLFRAQAPTR